MSAQLNTKVACRDDSNHLLKCIFGVCLCSVLVSLSNVSNLFQNGQFPILVAIFVTIATVKVKIIPDLNIWAIVLIRRIWGNFFGLIGGPK